MTTNKTCGYSPNKYFKPAKLPKPLKPVYLYLTSKVIGSKAEQMLAYGALLIMASASNTSVLDMVLVINAAFLIEYIWFRVTNSYEHDVRMRKTLDQLPEEF